MGEWKFTKDGREKFTTLDDRIIRSVVLFCWEFASESEAVAFDIDNDAVMQEAVKDGCDSDLVVEQFCPVGKCLVGSDDGAFKLIMDLFFLLMNLSYSGLELTRFL